jgi:amidase
MAGVFGRAGVAAATSACSYHQEVPMKLGRFSAAIAVAPLLVLGLSAGSVQASQDKSVRYDPDGQSLAQIENALRTGRTTSAQLVDFYLARIERYDKQGPKLNAVIRVNAQAEAEAKKLDTARRAGAKTDPLYGIPFVVKDNYNVVGMPTTGGSVALANNYPAKNATVVQRLIDQGAIVLAKTNMSELAASYGRLGYSSVGGLTLNPFDLKRNASGSSSGTAAAVAADLAPFGLGTDTSGSVRGPASVTGQVGVRPTLGLTSRQGVIPLSLSFDTTAPIAHSVADEATVLQAMAGPDPADPATADAGTHHDYAAALDDHALRGARVGVLTQFFGGNAEVDATVKSALNTMRAHGATAVPVDLGASYSTLWNDVLGPVGDMEFASEFENYLAGEPDGTIKTLDQLIAISTSPGVTSSATPVNPGRIDGYRAAAAARGELGGAQYDQITEQVMPALRAHVQELMKKENLDALVFPTLSCVASPRFDENDPTYSCSADDPYAASYVSSATGLPEVTVPVGTDAQGLPIGMSFLGRAYSEQTLLDLADSWEHTARLHLQPTSVAP